MGMKQEVLTIIAIAILTGGAADDCSPYVTVSGLAESVESICLYDYYTDTVELQIQVIQNTSSDVEPVHCSINHTMWSFHTLTGSTAFQIISSNLWQTFEYEGSMFHHNFTQDSLGIYGIVIQSWVEGFGQITATGYIAVGCAYKENNRSENYNYYICSIPRWQLDMSKNEFLALPHCNITSFTVPTNITEGNCSVPVQMTSVSQTTEALYTTQEPEVTTLPIADQTSAALVTNASQTAEAHYTTQQTEVTTLPNFDQTSPASVTNISQTTADSPMEEMIIMHQFGVLYDPVDDDDVTTEPTLVIASTDPGLTTNMPSLNHEIKISCEFNCYKNKHPQKHLELDVQCNDCDEDVDDDDALLGVYYNWTTALCEQEKAIETCTMNKTNHPAYTTSRTFNFTLLNNLYIDVPHGVFVNAVFPDGSVSSADYTWVYCPLPQVGHCNITPPSGYALLTEFNITCQDFSVSRGFDLKYIFKTNTIDVFKKATVLQKGPSDNVTSVILQPGEASSNYTVYILVKAKVIGGPAYVIVSNTVQVSPPSLGSEGMSVSDLVEGLISVGNTSSNSSSQVDDLLQSGNQQEAVRLLEVISVSINTDTNSTDDSEKQQKTESNYFSSPRDCFLGYLTYPRTRVWL